MLHFAPRSRAGSALFRTWDEAHALWEMLAVRARFSALVLMPNHLHAIVEDERSVTRVRDAMRAYGQWRNARRGTSGPVWRHGETTSPVRAGSHAARTRRYVYLNPCRAGLVRDPLAWPYSSYRDALGLAIPALHDRTRDPAGLHALVSRSSPAGEAMTPLPSGGAEGRRRGLDELIAAVSSLTRTPLTLVRAPGPARTLFVRAARVFGHSSSRDIAVLLGVSASQIREIWWRSAHGTELVARVAGDARFAALEGGDLSRLPEWRAFLERSAAHERRRTLRSPGASGPPTHERR